jgi:hypothetical protein
VIPTQDPTNHYTLRISLTPLTGHISLYVTCGLIVTPNNMTAIWSLSPVVAGGSLDIEGISLLDHSCLVTSPILLAVYGDTSASYEIMATGLDQEDVIQLIPDIRFNGEVHDGTFDYYYVRPGKAYEDMKLMLLIFEGDADLYVSKSWETRPKYDATKGKVVSYDAASNVDGDDSLRVKVCSSCFCSFFSSLLVL